VRGEKKYVPREEDEMYTFFLIDSTQTLQHLQQYKDKNYFKANAIKIMYFYLKTLGILSSLLTKPLTH